MNLGIQESRRRGVQNSTGRFVIFLDQDDMLVNDGIALQIQYIGKENAIMSNGYYEDKNKKLILLYNSPKRQFKINNLFSYFCVGNLIISPGMCMIKRSSIPKQWMEAEQSLQINGADDWLLWVDYLSNGNKFSVNDKAVYIHKDVGSNASSDSSLMLNSLEQAVSLAGDTLNVPDHYIKTGKQRIRMRRIYEGKSSKYKLLAFAMHPILALYIFLWKYK
jgi:glycosyltransferase involved in cell wall biosynthesis